MDAPFFFSVVETKEDYSGVEGSKTELECDFFFLWMPRKPDIHKKWKSTMTEDFNGI